MSVIYYTPGMRFFPTFRCRKSPFVPGEAALYFPENLRPGDGLFLVYAFLFTKRDKFPDIFEINVQARDGSFDIKDFTG